MQTLALTVTGLNLVLFVAMLGQTRAAGTDAIPAVVRARAVELVDTDGTVRSRLNVEPGGAVVFRLFDQMGTIRVKLGADQEGSGLMLADEATEPGVHLVARRSGSNAKPATTRLVLTGADGQQRVIQP